MRKISITLIFNVLSIFLSLNIQAQNVICIGSVTSTSITDFGIKDPSFQTKWNAYLQNRTWKWASGHITVTKEFVKF
jgi:hypothetical protein